MEFTYQAYRDLLALLRAGGYVFCNYHNYINHPRCVILRHDIDQSVEKALDLARLEAEEGVLSTYFVLLTGDLYNAASRRSRKLLEEIQNLGHGIGLHFDETAYEKSLTPEEMIGKIQQECGQLSALLDTPVSTVSMHRPSKETLEADLQIPGIVNSYGKTFFRDFKYLSDSRRRWREPVLEIVGSGHFDRLHILTHAIWYHEREESIAETLEDFVRSAGQERYRQLEENITNLAIILKKEEVLS